MTEFLQIIKGTPLYVWAILVYLLFIGIKSIKTRVVYLPKLFIIPLILLIIKYQTLFSEDILAFCSMITVASIASFFIHAGNKLKIIKTVRSIEVPGNYATLIILLFFFIVKYYFGYLKSVDQGLYLKYSIIENIITGLFSGYFIGRGLCYTYKYLKS